MTTDREYSRNETIQYLSPTLLSVNCRYIENTSKKKARMQHGTPIGEGLRMAVYPIRPKEEKEAGERCSVCERKYTNKRKPVLTIIGYGTNNLVFDWECEYCAVEDTPWCPTAIVVEDTVNWRGEYWERTLHPSEARYKKAFGQWVPEGYETDLEELHRTVATNALETKFNES